MREPRFNMPGGNCVSFSNAPDEWLRGVISCDFPPGYSDDLPGLADADFLVRYAGILLSERTGGSSP